MQPWRGSGGSGSEAQERRGEQTTSDGEGSRGASSGGGMATKRDTGAAQLQQPLIPTISEEDSGVGDARAGDANGVDKHDVGNDIDHGKKQGGHNHDDDHANDADDVDDADALASLDGDVDFDTASGQGSDGLDDDDFDVLYSTDDNDDDVDGDNETVGAANGPDGTTAQASPEATPKALSALIPSPFPTRPPVIRFCYTGDNVQVEPLDAALRQGLKWKFQSTTPNLVKKMVRRVGFQITEKNGWVGTWGKHLKATSFRHIRTDQKLNHFPGSFQLGRKDRMWRNVAHMQARHGRKHFDFVPDTYCLPGDLQLLKRAWDAAGSAGKWIMKPNASARGIGIRVIYQWSQVPKRKTYLVQRYLSRPYLINGAKFDLRVYVYVSSFDPLKVYICREGLARFATQKYSNKKSKLRNRYMHLTNYSINKKSSKFVQNDDVSMCQGHKWGLQALWKHMREQDGVDTDCVWDSICDIVIKTLLSVDSIINSAVKFNCKSRSVCHELFGFDIMLSSNLKPYLIEVNISPSMASSSPLDKDIKGRLLRDVFNIAGFLPPAYRSGCQTETLNEAIWKDRGTKGFSSHLSQNERQKHAYFVQHYEELAAKGKLHTILDSLTDDDVCMLMEAEEELTRKGDLDRLVPSPAFESHFRFMETPRYYNVLLSEWCKRYHPCPNKGVEYLQTISEEALARAQNGALRTRQPPLSHATAFTSATQFYMSPSKPKGRHNLPSIARTRSHQASARERGSAAESSAQNAQARQRTVHAAAVRLRKAASASVPRNTAHPHAPGQSSQHQQQQQQQQQQQHGDAVASNTSTRPRSLSPAGVVRDRTGRVWRVRNAQGDSGSTSSSKASSAGSIASRRQARPPTVAVTREGNGCSKRGTEGHEQGDDGGGDAGGSVDVEGHSAASDEDGDDYEDIFGGDDDDDHAQAMRKGLNGEEAEAGGGGGGGAGQQQPGEADGGWARPHSCSGELKGEQLLSAVLRVSNKGRHRTHYHQHHHPRPVFRTSSRSSRSSSRNSSSRPSSALLLRSPTNSLSSTSLSAALSDVNITNWSARSTMRRQARMHSNDDDDHDCGDDESESNGSGQFHDGAVHEWLRGDGGNAAPSIATTDATTNRSKKSAGVTGHRPFVADPGAGSDGDDSEAHEDKERAYREHSMTAMLHQTHPRSMHATASAAEVQPRQLLLQQQQQQQQQQRLRRRPSSGRISSATQQHRWTASSRIASAQRRLNRGQADSGVAGRSITRSRAVSAASGLRNVDITFAAKPQHHGTRKNGAAARSALSASRVKRGRRGSTLSVTGTRYDSAASCGDGSQWASSRAQVLSRLARYK